MRPKFIFYVSVTRRDVMGTVGKSGHMSLDKEEVAGGFESLKDIMRPLFV